MSQTHDLQRRAYATPHLKLYGSVQALTAAGTGPTNEANLPGTSHTYAVDKCNHGVSSPWTPSTQTFKHCF